MADPSLLYDAGEVELWTVLKVTMGATDYYWSDTVWTDKEISGIPKPTAPYVLQWGETFRGLGNRGRPERSALELVLDGTDGVIPSYIIDFVNANSRLLSASAELSVGVPGGTSWADRLPIDQYIFGEYVGNDAAHNISVRFVQNDRPFGPIRVPTVLDVEAAFQYDGDPFDSNWDLKVPIVMGNFARHGMELPGILVSNSCTFNPAGTFYRGALFVFGLLDYGITLDEPAGFETYFVEAAYGGNPGQASEYLLPVTYKGRTYQLLCGFWRNPPYGIPSNFKGDIQEEIMKPAFGAQPKLHMGVHIKGKGDSGSPTHVVTPIGIAQSLVEDFAFGTWDDTTRDNTSIEDTRSKCKRLGYSATWIIDEPKESTLSEIIELLSSFDVDVALNNQGRLKTFLLDPDNEDLITGFPNAFKATEKNAVLESERHWRFGERWGITNGLRYKHGGELARYVYGAVSRYIDESSVSGDPFIRKKSGEDFKSLELTDAMKDSIDIFTMFADEQMFPGALDPRVAKRVASDYVARRLKPRSRIVFSTRDILGIAPAGGTSLGAVIRWEHFASVGSINNELLCRVEGVGYDPATQTFIITLTDFSDILGGGFFILGDETDWQLTIGTTMDITQSGSDVLVHFDAVPTDAVAVDDHIVITSGTNSFVLRITSKTDTQNFTAASQTLPGGSETNLVENTDYIVQQSYESAKVRGTTAADSDAYSVALTWWGHLCDESTEQFTGGDAGKWLKDE